MVSTLASPAIIVFLDQDYHYKSVATQIPHYAGLTPIHPARDRSWEHCVQDNDSVSVPLQQTVDKSSHV